MHLFPLLLLAAAFWGQTPACGQPSIGLTEFPPPTVGLADLADCSITVDPSRLTFAGAECMTVVHEFGHLLGQEHSLDPESVMYPVLQKPVWPCSW
jgi:hypothetical protein